MRKLFYKDSNLIHGVTGPITQAPTPHPGPPSKASTLAIRRSVHELWGVYNIQAIGRGRGPAGALGRNPTSSTQAGSPQDPESPGLWQELAFGPTGLSVTP